MIPEPEQLDYRFQLLHVGEGCGMLDFALHDFLNSLLIPPLGFPDSPIPHKNL